MFKTFEAELDELHPMMDFVCELARNAGIVELEITRIQLALEEALVNVINYAYPDTSGQVYISCEVLDGKELQIEIQDSGVAFNPFEEAEKVDVNASADERRIGGLGVMMMQELMDEVCYERQEDKNILKMKKLFDNNNSKSLS